MDERNLEEDISMGEPGETGLRQGEKVPEISVNYNSTPEDTFALEQPFHEEAWEEEDIPLTGEINSVDTFINGEQFLNNPFEEFQSTPEQMSLSEDDPFDAYRADEFERDSRLSDPDADTGSEFAGELAPAAGMNGFTRSREDISRGNYHASDNGGLQEDAPEGNKTMGWIAIIMAIVSLFYWPAVLGPAAAVFGVIAFMRGSRALGTWSVVLGLVAVLAFLFLVPYYS
jgi:hypothetical protein